MEKRKVVVFGLAAVLAGCATVPAGTLNRDGCRDLAIDLQVAGQSLEDAEDQAGALRAECRGLDLDRAAFERVIACAALVEDAGGPELALEPWKARQDVPTECRDGVINSLQDTSTERGN